MNIKQLREIPMGHPFRGRQIQVGVFRPISRYISQMVQDSAIVAMEGE